MVEGMDKEGMRFNVMEANLMVATTTASFGYDVLDLHHMLMHQVGKLMQVRLPPECKVPVEGSQKNARWYSLDPSGCEVPGEPNPDPFLSEQKHPASEARLE